MTGNEMCRLAAAEIEDRIKALDGWTLEGSTLVKIFHFQNYYEAVAFVNASAWISHRADHHPDIELGYNQCKLTYTSHDIGGLSERDFTCAAKVDSLFKL